MPWHLQNPDAIYPKARPFPNNFNKDWEFFNEKRIFVFLQTMKKRICIIALIWAGLLGISLCLPGKAWLSVWLPLLVLYIINHLLFSRLYLRGKKVWYGVVVIPALCLMLLSVNLLTRNGHPGPPPLPEVRPLPSDSARMMPPPPPRPGEMPTLPPGSHEGEVPPPRRGPLQREPLCACLGRQPLLHVRLLGL